MVPLRIFGNRSANTAFVGSFVHGMVLWAFAYDLIIFVCALLLCGRER
jgi:hypothetical protein